MKKLLLILSIIIFTVSVNAQFEGSVNFEKSKGKVSVKYQYKVKGENVRVEEYGNEGSLDGIQLVNTTSQSVYALSPDRLMYMEAKNKRPQRIANVTVQKTKTKKTVNGKPCVKWIVTNTDQDRKIIYWVTKGDYDFFIPFLKTLNRAEKTSVYFLQIEGNAGFFPMLAEEYNMAGLLISKLEANKVTAKSLSDSDFKVPAGYKKFQR
jgi:hypothetical protein